MTLHPRILGAVFAALLTSVALAAAPALGATGSGRGTAAAPLVDQARLGGLRSTGRRSYGTGYRRRVSPYRTRPYRARPHAGRRFARGVLQALGIAYLAHLLFGYGAGGSPFGLLLLVALIAWFVSASRRRRRHWAYG